MLVAGVLVSLLLVAANAFFVAVEFAITRVRSTQVADWEREGRAGAGALRHAVDHIDAYLAACQLGITIASLGLGAVGERALRSLLSPVVGETLLLGQVGIATALGFALITLMHVVAGELTPKSLAIARTERTALVLAPPMRVFYVATKPLVEAFNWLGNLLLRPFGVPPAREVGHAPHTEAELRQVLSQSAEEGEIEGPERTFALRALEFDDRDLRGLVHPAEDVVALSTDDSVDGALRRVSETGFRRFPLCRPERGLDAVVGIVDVRDLVRAVVDGRSSADLEELARPAERLPRATPLSEALARLRRARRHMAVVEEGGSAVGIVTVEDLLEQLVGEIDDEAREPAPRGAAGTGAPPGTATGTTEGPRRPDGRRLRDARGPSG